MKYQQGDYVAVLAHPVWRARSNFVFRVPIEGEGDERHWEQLWWERLRDTRFVLCCIPFFAHDLSLGDEVVVDANRSILRITKPSGQWTYRVWFGDLELDRREVALERHPADDLCLSVGGGDMLGNHGESTPAVYRRDVLMSQLAP